MAPFDLHEVIIGHITLEICRGTGTLKLSEILSQTIMMQTWYRTHLCETSFDLGEIIKGHYMKNMEKNLGIAIYRHKYIKLWYIEDRIGANQTWFIEIMGMALFDVQEVVLGHMTQKNYRRMGEGVSMAQIGVETWNF